MPEDSRLTWIDALRLMAGLSMVGLHATADASGGPWAAYTVGERVGPIVIRSFLYIARTELFIIISLFLLLLALERRPRTYAAVCGQQARRLLIPFLFWTLFYAGYGLMKAGVFGYWAHAVDDLRTPAQWVGFLLLGDVKYHMHFIPTLFGVLLFFPLYRLAIAYPQLGFAVGLGLVVKWQLDAFIYSNFWGHDALPYLVRGTKILTYMGYGMFAGAALGLYRRTTAQNRVQWLPLIAFAGLILALFKAIGSYKTIADGAYPFGYAPTYWADFLMPVVLFLGCMTIADRNWPALLSRLAPYSFGIYLCHPIFLDVMEISVRDQGLSPTAQVSLKIAVVVPATAAFVFALKRFRPLAWTIGLGPLPGFGMLRSDVSKRGANAV